MKLKYYVIAKNPSIPFARLSRKFIGSFPIAIVAIYLGLSNQVFASAEVHKICEFAAQKAATATGVPVSVLRAISLTETGRRKDGAFRPWPWTVNMEGKGVWFETEDEARAYVYKNYKRGARSFDVGCFQLNYKWHGKAFSSVEQMFDPQAGANYAANFLKDLFAELGNWPDAAGAYHSRTPKYANKYKARFNSIRAGLDDLPQAFPATEIERSGNLNISGRRVAEIEDHENRFPLLFSDQSQTSTLGSLVPANAGSGRPRLIGGGT